MSGSSGIGILGFFAVKRGAQDWSEQHIVSNHHVLMAHGGCAGQTLYQPDIKVGKQGLRFDKQRLNPIAIISSEGYEGNYSYSYPGEPSKKYFVDCAAASLLHSQPRRQDGKSFAYTSVGRVHKLDTVPGQELRVRKLGLDDNFTGKIIDCGATVIDEAGQKRYNNIRIRSLRSSRVPPRPFAAEGDSGALIVDEFNRAIGLLWGINLSNPFEAYASHIHPVLNCMDMQPSRQEYAALAIPAKTPAIQQEKMIA